jgi:hydroxymethylpyrimidine/phosphomethylpyrimidine kinase
MTAITAITAQNTVGVTAVHPVPPGLILAQVEAVVDDIGLDAVKVGMVGTAAAIEAVARALDLVGAAPVVVDPVLIAESGAELLEPDAREALRTLLLPRAAVATPNLPEARALADASGEPPPEAPELLARAVQALGPATVVVTGGHAEDAADHFFDGERAVRLPGARHPGGAAHGSGCTHSSALAAFLAHGLEPLEAAYRAKEVASEAVREGLHELGGGAGPVDALGVRARAGEAAAERRGGVPADRTGRGALA